MGKVKIIQGVKNRLNLAPKNNWELTEQGTIRKETNYLKKFSKKKLRFLKIHKKDIFELVNPEKGDFILDLGCGTGRYVAYFSNICKVIGVDVNPQDIKYAKKFALKEGNKNNFKFFCNKNVKLDDLFSKNTFTKVALIDLVEHVPNEMLIKLFSEIKKILRKDGKLYIYTPNRDHIFEYFKNEVGHINLMTMKNLKDFLECEDFEIIKSYYRYSHIPIFNFFERIIPLICFKRRLCVIAKNIK